MDFLSSPILNSSLGKSLLKRFGTHSQTIIRTFSCPNFLLFYGVHLFLLRFCRKAVHTIVGIFDKLTPVSKVTSERVENDRSDCYSLPLGGLMVKPDMVVVHLRALLLIGIQVNLSSNDLSDSRLAMAVMPVLSVFNPPNTLL